MVVLGTLRSTQVNRPRHPSRTLRRGAEAVEMVFALPILLLVTFAGFEYGWVILRCVQLEHAARIGARESALSGASAESIEATVRQSLTGVGMPNATVTITPADPAAAAAGTSIRVDIEVEYATVKLLGLSRLMPLPQTLRGRASMVREPDS